MAHDRFKSSMPFENTPKATRQSIPDSVGLVFLGDISPCCLVSVSRHAETLSSTGNRLNCSCGTVIKAKAVCGAGVQIGINNNSGMREYIPAEGKTFAGVLFDRKVWNEPKAERYLRGRDIENYAQRPSNQSYVYMLCPTEWLEDNSIQVANLGNGVVGITGKLREEFATLSDEALDNYVGESDFYSSF